MFAIIFYVVIFIVVFIHTINRGIIEYKDQRIKTKEKLFEILFEFNENLLECGYFWSAIGLAIIGPFTLSFFICKNLAVNFVNALYKIVEESEKK